MEVLVENSIQFRVSGPNRRESHSRMVTVRRRVVGPAPGDLHPFTLERETRGTCPIRWNPIMIWGGPARQRIDRLGAQSCARTPSHYSWATALQKSIAVASCFASGPVNNTAFRRLNLRAYSPITREYGKHLA